MASRLLRWTESFDIHLDARYLPGQANVLADVLSRHGQVVGTEWSLHPQLVRSLLRVWGIPSIDLFATCLNTKLPLYCSLVPDPQAVFEDAFRHPWDDLDLYAVPSLSSGRSGDHPCPRVVEGCDDSGRTPLAREGVVRRLTNSTDPTTSRPALVGQSAPAAPLQPLPPRRPRAELSRVISESRAFREGLLESCQGASDPPPRASTSRDGRSSVVGVVEGALLQSTVKGYSSALNLGLALKGQAITMLLRSFSRSVDPVELRPPAWDVALVLQSLTGAPYEPLQTCDECFLAQKTLFLLALASGKRIGELHALSYRVSHSRGWAEVSFSFVPGFMAKTQDSSSLAPRFEGFTVPALPNARKNRNGRMLCPVREVRCYLDRTAAHRPVCEQLFVTAGRNKEISKTTVSFWLRKMISRAYELSGTEQPVPAPRARETRGIAPSLLFKKNFAVDQVLKAGTWRRHTTFTRPWVAAQALV